MTERDCRAFLFKSRSNIEGLLNRLRNEPVEKFLPITSDQGETFARFREKLFIQDEKEKIRTNKLQNEQQNSRVQRLTKQHQATWTREWARLKLLEQQVATELMELPLVWQDDALIEETESIMSLQKSIADDYKNFFEATVIPILRLRWDLQLWQNTSGNGNSGHTQGDASLFHKTIKSVQKEQEKLLMTLELDASELEISENLLTKCNKQQAVPYQGVPSSLNFTDCPEHLKSSITDEFLILDIKYQEKLSLVDERRNAFVRSRFGGWSQKQHELFKHVMELYPSHILNWDELMYDLLGRLLPQYTLDDLLNHQSWIALRRRYKESVSAVLSDWLRAKNELLTKAQAIIYRAQKVFKENNERAVALKKQKSLCRQLYLKVVHWRQWKLQKISLDEERERLNFIQEKQTEELMEKDRRLIIKQKLLRYIEEKKLNSDNRKEKMKNEYLKLKKAKIEQHIINKERIRFREKLRNDALEKQKLAFLQRLRKEKAKQKKLEDLRLSVAVHAQPDPKRLLQSTFTVEAKRKHEYEDDPIPNLKPLFQVYTFTEEQLAADPRTRLEEKLRDANLLHLPHAREVLDKLQPPTVPRKDAKSSICFES